MVREGARKTHRMSVYEGGIDSTELFRYKISLIKTPWLDMRPIKPNSRRPRRKRGPRTLKTNIYKVLRQV